MKPVLSFFVILVLFQSLILGSLVKLELPEAYQYKWEKTVIHKQIVLDPFMVPGRDGINPNQTFRYDWEPFHFNNVFISSTSLFEHGAKYFLHHPGGARSKTSVAVYILNATLRL